MGEHENRADATCSKFNKIHEFLQTGKENSRTGSMKVTLKTK